MKSINKVCEINNEIGSVNVLYQRRIQLFKAFIQESVNDKNYSNLYYNFGRNELLRNYIKERNLYKYSNEMILTMIHSTAKRRNIDQRTLLTLYDLYEIVILFQGELKDIEILAKDSGYLCFNYADPKEIVYHYCLLNHFDLEVTHSLIEYLDMIEKNYYIDDSIGIEKVNYDPTKTRQVNRDYQRMCETNQNKENNIKINAIKDFIKLHYQLDHFHIRSHQPVKFLYTMMKENNQYYQHLFYDSMHHKEKINLLVSYIYYLNNHEGKSIVNLKSTEIVELYNQKKNRKNIQQFLALNVHMNFHLFILCSILFGYIEIADIDQKLEALKDSGYEPFSVKIDYEQEHIDPITIWYINMYYFVEECKMNHIDSSVIYHLAINLLIESKNCIEDVRVNNYFKRKITLTQRGYE